MEQWEMSEATEIYLAKLGDGMPAVQDNQITALRSKCWGQEWGEKGAVHGQTGINSNAVVTHQWENPRPQAKRAW